MVQVHNQCAALGIVEDAEIKFTSSATPPSRCDIFSEVTASAALPTCCVLRH